jgi:hypothetical protein
LNAHFLIQHIPLFLLTKFQCFDETNVLFFENEHCLVLTNQHSKVNVEQCSIKNRQIKYILFEFNQSEGEFLEQIRLEHQMKAEYHSNSVLLTKEVFHKFIL